MNNKLAVTIIVILLALFSITFFKGSPVTLGVATPGLDARVGTSSTVSLAAGTPILLFATSTCTSRIVSTGVSALQVSFFDRPIRATGIVGYPIAASSTATFDSGLVGCGAMYGFSYAAQTVMLTETD